MARDKSTDPQPRAKFKINGANLQRHPYTITSTVTPTPILHISGPLLLSCNTIPPPPWRNSPPVGQGLLIIASSRSHSDTPHSVRLLWMSDLPYVTTHNTHKRETAMPSAGFEPAVSASGRPQNHALDRVVTRIGHKIQQATKNFTVTCR